MSKSKALKEKTTERAIDRVNRTSKKPSSVFGKKLGEKLLNRNRGERPYTRE